MDHLRWVRVSLVPLSVKVSSNRAMSMLPFFYRSVTQNAFGCLEPVFEEGGFRHVRPTGTQQASGGNLLSVTVWAKVWLWRMSCILHTCLLKERYPIMVVTTSGFMIIYTWPQVMVPIHHEVFNSKVFSVIVPVGVSRHGLVTNTLFLINHESDPSPYTVQWYHLAVSYDNTTQTFKMYRNAILVASSTYSGVPWVGNKNLRSVVLRCLSKSTSHMSIGIKRLKRKIFQLFGFELCRFVPLYTKNESVSKILFWLLWSPPRPNDSAPWGFIIIGELFGLQKWLPF